MLYSLPSTTQESHQMSQITPFQFHQHSIRTVQENGELLFVGKDVAGALGYVKPENAITQHCKGSLKRYPLPTAGGVQKMIVITMPDVYRLIVNSQLESAQKFERWVFEEVLPSIHKTGSYTVEREEVTEPASLTGAAREFRAALSVAKHLFDGNQAKLAAAKATRQVTGVDLLKMLGATHLLADQQHQLLTATEVGRRCGFSAREINPQLEYMGLQTHYRDAKGNLVWELTDAGKEYGVYLDTGKKHSDGTPVRQIKWNSNLTHVLEGSSDGEPA